MSSNELPQSEVNNDSQPSINRKKIPLKIVRNLMISAALVVLGMGFGYQIKGLETKIPRLLSGVGIVRPVDKSSLDFSQFWQVWSELEQTYVDPTKLDSEKMIQGAIQGMTAALGDPYTVYLPPQDNQASKEDLNGQFDGVGIQLGYKKGTIAVQTPLENHPAIKAGVKAGDLILHIKDAERKIDQDTTGLSLTEAVKLIRGKKGTQVTLTFYREGIGTIEKTITRETIIMPSVELSRGDVEKDVWQKKETGGIAWLKVNRFGENTQEQWDDAVTKTQRDRNQIKGIVLDLRNNPGGLLQSSISLASEFIPDGLVVKQQGRMSTQEYNVNRKGRLIGIPLVVLINGGSASASEILAGALRDRLGVKLIGEKSFGKGTVQQVIDLDQGAGLHVTAAKWLLPNGDWIHEKGITPAIEVASEDASGSAVLTTDAQLNRAASELK